MGLNDCVLVKIKALGKPLSLPLGSYVLEFSYEDVEKGHDMLKMRFSDPFKKLADSDQFTENAEWSVQWGHPGSMRPARKVLLKRPHIRHGEVEIQALDKGSALKVTDRHDVIKMKTQKEVIEEIAQKNGLKAVVDSSLTDLVEFFAYGGRSDYDVLEYFRTRVEDHFFKIVEDTLYFQRRDRSAPPSDRFTYGRDSRILEYDIVVKDQETAKGALQVSLLQVDPKTFKSSVSVADESTTSTTNLGNRRPHSKYAPAFLKDITNQTKNGGAKPIPGKRMWTGKFIPTPPSTKKRADAISHAARADSLDGAVEAKFKILAAPGDPFYKSGDIIRVDGIGKKYSGGYRIVEITHDLSNGYIYEIKAKRNALNAIDSGPLPFLNGPVNYRLNLPVLAQTITRAVRGSVTGAIYGAAGRIV